MARLALPRKIEWPGGLSARLLLLTAAFVMVVEILILIPSLAAFQERWLTDRVRGAEFASVAVELAPDQVVPEQMAAQLLEGAGVAAVAVGSDGTRRLLLRAPREMTTPDLIDLRRSRGASWLAAPWQTFFGAPDRMLRVVARPQFRSGEFVEVVVPAQPLKRELFGYLLRILALSAALSFTAGGLVFGALSAFIVRPMRRVTESIERFRADPEDATLSPPVSDRRDEIGRVEAELARMQDEVRQALRSRARLAALGQAVAKINHDLRNMLTSAQMASERLAGSGDPAVAKALPRLERALDRALALAQNTLAYGRSEEPPPQPRRFALWPALEAAAEDAGLSAEGVRLSIEAAKGFKIDADPEQLHRVLVNLFRNARQAIEAEPGRAGRGRVTVRARRDDDHLFLTVADDGPGVPKKALDALFQPFQGTAKAGGAGLGLAISRELAQAHGGDLSLVENGPEGAVFELRLPAAAAPAEALNARDLGAA